ncbi:hypothetical protein C8035_v012221 [Colletotrichum spinosum]|uniref:Uncharacterized protein n=1 Tax=Colletotrichum spinosum TaxID=1347390 RepID=A0A4R8Q8P5_9PEZI|nr:hypothetical protein C8035_v012221 [Colletotrichum spinosum]
MPPPPPVSWLARISGSNTIIPTPACTMTIQGLPDELLALIASKVRDLRALASMALTNRRLNYIATTALYQEEVYRKDHLAIFHCAETGNIGGLELLRVHGQNLTVRMKFDLQQGTPRNRPSKKQTRWLQAYWDTLLTDEPRRGAIHFAILNGQLDTVRWLISYGVPVNQPILASDSFDAEETTPLQLAYENGEFGAVLVLLVNGAADALQGSQVWHKALEMGHVKPGMEFAMSVASSHLVGATSTEYSDIVAPGETSEVELATQTPNSDVDMLDANTGAPIFRHILTDSINNMSIEKEPAVTEGLFGHKKAPTSAACAAVDVLNQPHEVTRNIEKRQNPSEEDVINAILLICDPLDAAVAMTEIPREVTTWERRKQQYKLAHKGKVVKRTNKKAKRDAVFQARKTKETRMEAAKLRQDNKVTAGKLVRQTLGPYCAMLSKRFGKGDMICEKKDCFACSLDGLNAPSSTGMNEE